MAVVSASASPAPTTSQTPTEVPSDTAVPSDSPAAGAVSAPVGLRYVARLCIVNRTTGTLKVHWENAEHTWWNNDSMGSRATYVIDRGDKTCGSGRRLTEHPDAPGNPMAIDQMNVWATFTSALQPRTNFRAGADNRPTNDAMQAGIEAIPGTGERVYPFPVGEQRAWTMSEIPLVLDRLPNDDRRSLWGPLAMFTLTVGRS